MSRDDAVLVAQVPKMQAKLLGAIATTLASAGLAFAEDLVIGVPNCPSVTGTAKVIETVVEANMGLTWNCRPAPTS